ncbi:MAG TPA: MFS transporter [Firmicutes bacterium]|nr:MFS transporter [Candidatus Fermentithermobacillaceae bacterium]
MGRLKTAVGTVLEDLRQRDVERAREPDVCKTERNIRINVYHGIVSIISVNLAAPFIGIFAVKLGASNFEVGLLSSGPALVSLLSMIPGGKFIDRRPDQKRILGRLIFLQRLFYLFIATIPFFTSDSRAPLLVAAVALMNMPASIANVGWQAFISRIVPPARRAEAFASRNRLMNLVGTLVVLLTGRIIDVVGFPLGYQIVFAAAFVVALVEIWVFNHIDDSTAKSYGPADILTPDKAPKGVLASIVDDIRQIFRQGPFKRYLLASAVFYFAWQTPWPLFTLYQVKVLGANNLWVSLLNLANTGGSLVGYGFWVRMMNKHGNLKTLFMSSIWIFIVPLVYGFSHSLTTVAVFNLLTGAIFSGVNLALFNALLEVTPEETKATYIAYYTTAVNGSAILAPMAGVALLDTLGFFWAFMVCAALRIAGSLTFLVVNYLERRTSSRPSATTGTAVPAS